jgi:hypothetical protein
MWNCVLTSKRDHFGILGRFSREKRAGCQPHHFGILGVQKLSRPACSSGDVARKAAWQFLNKVNDPRMSTLRRFAKAMGVDVRELL